MTGDRNNGTDYGGAVAGKAEHAALGFGFSKRFGPTELNINVTRDLYLRNTVGGNKLRLNLTMPLSAGG